MASYEIACPHHGKIETLELPEAYHRGFQGEVGCGDENESKPLKIQITRGVLHRVERAN